MLGAVAYALVVGFALVLLIGPSMYWRDRWGREVRRQAEEKGVALLRSWLSAEQVRQWDSHKEFDVVGSDTGTHYRIRYGTAMNVHELDSAGRAVIQWCFAPQGSLVVGDVLLAQKLALETMEREALAQANNRLFGPCSGPIMQGSSCRDQS
jgi:hypothetical protein